MSLITEMPEDTFSDRGTDWQALQHRFEAKRAAFLQEKLILQAQCHSLREQTHGLEQERGIFEQERLSLWKDIQARGQPGDSPEHQLHDLQERIKRSQAFLDALRQQQHTFQDSRQAFQDKLRILREQHRAVRDIPEPTQRQQAFQQVQAECLQLQQDLREQTQVLCEQQATYRRLRLDYEAQRMQLHAEKLGRQQRQEERRWPGYGNS
jgi:hypothetical protein